MHEDLIKRLREEADCPDNYAEDSCLMREAADAMAAMNYELKSLYKLLGTHPDPRGENGEAGVLYNRATAKAIESIPVADVRPVVRGRWVEFETDTPPRRSGCSECGFITNPWLAHVYNFCPNCGADMRESSKEKLT